MGAFLLNVPYEANGPADPESYCGAHVLRMIFESVGVSPVLPVQQMLQHASSYNDANEGWPFWYIDPGAMWHTLWDFYPQGDWVTYQNTTQPEADNQIQSTLANYQVATANLVNGGKHWVCVVGYTYDTSNNLTGFFINDPTYNGGGANLGVALSTWDSAYSPVSGGVKWLGKIIEVGDPRPVLNPLGRAPRPIVRPGSTILSPEEAVGLAVEGALAHFAGMPHLERAIEQGRPAGARLVARMDREGSYYYLVPLAVEGGEGDQVLGAIMVDARFGDVLSVSATEEPYALWPIRHEGVRDLVTRQPIPVYESADVAAGRLLDTILGSGRGRVGADSPMAADATSPGLRGAVTAALGSFAVPGDYVVLRPGEIEIDPIWVWWPCGGVSPFHPNYVVRTPWRNIYVNAYSGIIRTNFDFCWWNRLGG